MTLPTPHLDKINAAIANDKMPEAAVERLNNGLTRYSQWIAKMKAVEGNRQEVVRQLVQLFNDYKFYVDYELIYLCEVDFLYRQKGQLKLDNTVIVDVFLRFIGHIESLLSDADPAENTVLLDGYF